jgi:acetylornithine deacetylase/succinyl-diaminopimelate desuccinylase-like protein
MAELDTDPWQVAERGDHLVGRGVCDMKSYIAVALLVPQMQARPSAALHFALSYDEEVGCIGVRRLIADLANIEYKPRLHRRRAYGMELSSRTRASALIAVAFGDSNAIQR